MLATTSPDRPGDAPGRGARVRRRHRHPLRASTTAATPGGWTAPSSGASASEGRRPRGRNDNGIDLAASHAYSDSFFDLPLFRAVGHPHPLNADPRLAAVALARRWPLEHWDRPPGIPSVVGFEPYHLVRPFFRPEAFPYARFDIRGMEHVPGRARCCWPPTTAAISTWPPSAWWPPAWADRCASWPSRRSSTHRSWAAWPGPSAASRSTGGAGRRTRCGGPSAALRAGEVVIVLPQGTIPRGEAFFDPVLHGHTGAARLAAETGAPVIPIGLWGTEQVWPRSSRVPNLAALPAPPRVTVTVGPPVTLGLDRRGGRHRRAHGGHRRPAAGRGPGRTDPHRGGTGPHATAGVTVSARPAAARSRRRAAAAVEALKMSNRLSRALGPGSGTVAGGRVGLALDPGLLADPGRRAAGGPGHRHQRQDHDDPDAGRRPGRGRDRSRSPPTTPGPTCRPVTWPPWPGRAPGADAVLEVDEGYLGRLIAETRPRVVVLLNLSRDQLDRIAEVRMLVDRWRAALGGLARRDRGQCRHRGGGQCRRSDGGVGRRARPRGALGRGRPGVAQRRGGLPGVRGRDRLRPDGDGPATGATSPARDRHAWLEGSGPGHGRRRPLAGRDRPARPVQPGQRGHGGRGRPADGRSGGWRSADPAHRRGGAGPPGGARRGGRPVRPDRQRSGHPVRLLLAKNPAGWTAIFDLLDETRAEPAVPVVLSVNARIADGLDTSWLWDVPFERLAGRPVVATGERRLDLAVRLRYAEVPCTVVADPLAPLDRAVGMPSRPPPDPAEPGIDFLGNYTAFADLRSRL